ncbi:metal-dependent transcriptional regulator [Auritidibacter ignavus]|uniref:metal-dependent transcriptional regulator n=1 Tax=Auritidibacter ignavus TaxID=678932 RepID=UPI00109C48A7|nr:metal-dependent transcriptional regulator [Auritidibacter ignavus]WGH89788.1 metal-dependent transcriptional regulator [Auritidibacter ignavus]
MSELIDTTEMYLRTIYELQEEEIAPLRARIAERLEHSGPTVSQTINRMERDGLVDLGADRRIRLTDRGLAIAAKVMRKHRLAERLLSDVIGLEWPQVHNEACRWEHVMSDEVEAKLLNLLPEVSTSPFGIRIPYVSELEGGSGHEGPENYPGQRLTDLLRSHRTFRLLVITEAIQTDHGLLNHFMAAGIVVGSVFTAELDDGYIDIQVITPGQAVTGATGYSREGLEIVEELGQHLRVEPVDSVS